LLRPAILGCGSPSSQTADAIPSPDAIRGCDPRCNPAARSSFSCAMVSEWLLADPLGMRQSRANGAVSTYRVFVRDLDLRCSIGIHDHEKQPQRIRISAELVVADEPDISGDALAGVLNYSPIVKGIKAIATGGHINLVETLAERIIDFCFAERRVAAARVVVEKLDVYPDAGGVGVVIERRRSRAREAVFSS
jgi:7,8-dihydroneopterin aldolase/epimerase/oxygenase